MATITETGDLPPGRNVQPAIVPGDSFVGSLSRFDGQDAVPIELEMGQIVAVRYRPDPLDIVFGSASVRNARLDDGGAPVLTRGGGSVDVYLADETGRHFVQVSRQSRNGDGRYILDTEILTLGPDSSGDTGTTQAIAPGGFTIGALADAADSDWIAVDLDSTSLFTFSVRALDDFDPVMTVYGPDGRALLRADDRSRFDTDASAVFTPDAPGRYYIGVSGLSEADIGAYAVFAETTRFDPRGWRAGFDSEDVMIGSKADNTFFGGAGDDTLKGLGGRDNLQGHDGDDLILGGDAGDWLFGGWGRDTVFGGSGNDSVAGDYGDDLLHGGAGNDTVGDVVFPSIDEPGDDTMRGGGGHDSVSGGAGADRLYGYTGRDTLLGGGGEDALFGWRGPDRLSGGPGDDTLSGGPGADLFFFGPQEGRDLILDFDPAVDLLMIDPRFLPPGGTPADLLARHASLVEGGVALDMKLGTGVVLQGVSDLGALSAAIRLVESPYDDFFA